jgi:glycosyltransferase involved in cell wall biosynthesis
MRIGLDATPLLGTRTGVGRYVQHLIEALAAGDDPIVATAFTLRGAGDLASAVPAGVQPRHRPVPARALQAAWGRSAFPPVEWLCGRVDVFHATNFVLPPTRRAAGVVTVHDLTFLRYPETVNAATLRYQTLVPRSIRRAAVVCTPSVAVAEEVREIYPDAQVVVTPLGVDESWFEVSPPTAQWRREHGLPDEYVVFVGTREPRKNLQTLLAAYALRPDLPPLVLPGPPGWGPELDLAGVPAESVITPGYLDQPTLQRTVAGARALVLPSLYEGFGLPPLEAFACGTPVVASDIPVIREVTGGHARLVPPRDPEALADGLTQTLARPNDPELVEGRRRHARQWTWQRCAATTRAAYRLATR